MTRKYTVDPKSYELAEHFAQDVKPGLTEAELRDLSQDIQEAVEDWFEIREQKEKE